MRRFGVRMRPRRAGFTLLEVVVAMVIFLTGIVAIAGLFPMTIRQNRRTADRVIASYLAQMKAEELRRDEHFFGGGLISSIEFMDQESRSYTFHVDPRFAYSFSGETVLYTDLPSADPRAASDTARIIVRYDDSFRAQQDVLYELRFR